MKRLILVLAFLIMAVGISYADFKIYTVSVSSLPVTDAVGTYNIAGNIRIGKVILSNSDDTALQTVTLYKLGGSTTTITAIMTVNFGAGDQSAPFVLEFNTSDFLPVNALAIRKSVNTSTVNATILYR
jgi:hypothetical protein